MGSEVRVRIRGQRLGSKVRVKGRGKILRCQRSKPEVRIIGQGRRLGSEVWVKLMFWVKGGGQRSGSEVGMSGQVQRSEG